MDGPVIPKQPGDQRQPLAHQQDDPRPVERAGDAGQVHRDSIGLSVVRQYDGVVGGEVPGAGSALQLRILREKGDREKCVSYRLAVREDGVVPQGGDGIIAGLHPGDGVGGGDAPLLHQGGHRGTPVLRVEKQPGGSHEEQQQIHHQENDQLPEEKAEVQAKDQRGLGAAQRVLGRGGLESGASAGAWRSLLSVEIQGKITVWTANSGGQAGCPGRQSCPRGAAYPAWPPPGACGPPPWPGALSG